jgi:phosphatidyl-myo-inositol alpha-mannosyltransferase
VGETTRTDIPNVHSIGHNVKVRFNHNRMSIPLPVSKKKIRQLMSEQEFDIVHVQMPFSPMLGGRVVKAAGPQTGIVGTFHIAPHSRLVAWGTWLLGSWTQRTLRRFDEVISVSRIAQDFAWHTFRIESAIIPNTLRLGNFYDAKPFPQYERTTNVVFMGRLVERKGCAQLLHAVRRLHTEKALPDNCKVIICGKGPLDVALKDYVAKYDLSRLVDFTGFVSEEDKPRYLAGADVAVYPSTGGESFGIVLLEAMAAGRGIVLAGNNPGYAGVVGERPEALFDPNDTDQFARKLGRYLKDVDARREARNWQQQYVRQFDVPNVADEISVVYQQALHKRRS